MANRVKTTKINIKKKMAKERQKETTITLDNKSTGFTSASRLTDPPTIRIFLSKPGRCAHN
jgi:hypothetical protein